MQQIARIVSRRRSLSCGPLPFDSVVAFTPDCSSATGARCRRAASPAPRRKAISTPTIDELTIADEPARWAALGFDVADSAALIGAVRVRFAGASADAADGPRARGIRSWSLRDATSAELDGLPTTISERPVPAPAPAHPNGVLAIDHVVAFSPDLDRSIASLRAAGLDLRRVREQPTPAGAPRQAFFRLGREILELVQEPDEAVERAGGVDRPAGFWGLALLVADLDRCAQQLAPHVGEPRAAVQAGRRIATVKRSAGLSVPLALMSRDERDDRNGRDERDEEDR
jgi:catechol 2,3-dioxygenase-like lactoylglutathione lyase family enzyme